MKQTRDTPPTVLVVDDDRGLVRLVEKALQGEGLLTAGALSGQEAIQWLEQHQPDLMLLDLHLQDVQGKDLLERLRQLKRAVPFIIITGQGDERVAVEMMKGGAMDYLVKDANFLQFVPEVVRRTLARLDQERKLAAMEETLKRENAFTAAVLDTSGALILVLDREGRIARFNRACEAITGYSLDEARGRVFWDWLIPAEESEVVRGTFENLCAGQHVPQHESSLRTKSGELRWIAWSNAALLDGSGSVEYVISSGIDITERKRLEKEILQISELEQRRIGQDLHDGLCQQLAGIELMSQVLEQRLASHGNENAPRAADIARHVRDSIAQTRSLARGLSPVELDENGLMSALQQLAANVQSLFHVECEFRCETPVLVPDNVMATHLFRIAQEAVSNAVKHGKAKRIEIALTPLEDKLLLAISDNGHGFPKEPHKGMGLRIMNYRAGMLGGALSVRNEKNGGASVICSVPRSLFKMQLEKHA